MKGHIQIASNDLLLSSISRPLSSYFSALNAIISEIDGSLLTKFELPNILLDVSVKAFDIVLAVCADESPEGNLPASFRDMDIKTQEVISASGAQEDISSGEKSQLVLHHCFRTIKEATTALATCVEKYPMVDDNPDALVWVETIGDTLCRLLSLVSMHQFPPHA